MSEGLGGARVKNLQIPKLKSHNCPHPHCNNFVVVENLLLNSQILFKLVPNKERNNWKYVFK